MDKDFNNNIECVYNDASCIIYKITEALEEYIPCHYLDTRFSPDFGYQETIIESKGEKWKVVQYYHVVNGDVSEGELLCMKEKINNVKFNCQVLDKVLSNTILNKEGKDTNTLKFDDKKSLASYIKIMNDINLHILEKEVENE